MNPVTRKEVFLDAICDGEPCTLEPASREEQVLKKLAESMVGGGDIVNLYIKPGYTEYMWKNADDVGDNSKALTYDEAVDAAEKTVRITSYYGGAVVYATCHSICVNKTEGFVEFNHFDGGKYKVSMA